MWLWKIGLAKFDIRRKGVCRGFAYTFFAGALRLWTI